MDSQLHHSVPEDAYDFVVVGAGSAGCAVAARLSADPEVSVLVLEAGPTDQVPEVSVPFASTELWGSARDWDYATTAQSALDGRAVGWPRGRVLGGSSSLNFQMWLPGHPEDSRDWACAGWTGSDLTGPLRAAEGWTGAPGAGLGRGGPLRLSPPRDPDPSTHAFLAACAGAGLPEVADWGAATGYGMTPLTQYGGARWSAADAYLRPVLDRTNLDVVVGVDVARVVLSGDRAVGIEVDGRVVHARREVVVCCGAVGSPLLLMRSGIGDPRRLAEAGVPTAVSLPGVGANLRDHVVVDLPVGASGPSRFTDVGGAEAVAAYESGRTGPLSSNVGEAVALLRGDGGPGAPDTEFIWVPLVFGEEGPMAGFTVACVLLRPESSGRVDLGGDGTALIDPGYLTHPADLPALVAAVRQAERVLDRPELAPLLDDSPRPWAGSDEDVARFVRAAAGTMYHPVGTCRIGAADDPGAVVDPALRVRGVDGLRVADASVVPRPPRGHTHAHAVAVGERAAALIAGEPAALAAQ